jgi:hypothetical protein
LSHRIGGVLSAIAFSGRAMSALAALLHAITHAPSAEQLKRSVMDQALDALGADKSGLYVRVELPRSRPIAALDRPARSAAAICRSEGSGSAPAPCRRARS